MYAKIQRALRASSRLQRRRSNRPLSPRKFQVRPGVESLEERRLLATFTVTSAADSGTGTLRQAIIDANDTPAVPDTIQFDFGGSPTTIALSSPLPTVSDNLEIDGTGESVSVSHPTDPILTVNPMFTTAGASIVLRNLTFSTPGKAVVLNGADGSLIDGLKFTPTTSGQARVRADNTDGLVIQNTVFSTTPSNNFGLHVVSGSDVTIRDNDFSDMQQAFLLQSVVAGSLPGGVDIRRNDYSNMTGNAIEFVNLSNLTIAPDAGANVDVRNASSNETLNTVNGRAILLNLVSNSVVRDVDISGGTYGLQAQSVTNLTVDNVNASGTSSNGIWVSGGNGFTVTNSDLSASTGVALSLTSVSNVNVASNDYTGSSTGIQLTSMSNVTISDGTAPLTANYIDVRNGSGVETLTTVMGLAIELNSVTNSSVVHVDVSGPTQSQTGIRTSSSTNLTMDKIVAIGRAQGVNIISSNQVHITCSAFFANTNGIRVENSSNSSVHDSNIATNVLTGVDNETAQLFDAEGNYWGSTDGPSPTGSGDVVEGNVDFDPFRSTLSSCTPIAVPPVAVDDTATTDEELSVAILVLANDSDPNGEDLAIASISTPANGTATLNDNGTPGNTTDDYIDYLPNTGFAGGTDTFTYTIVNDSGLQDTATVTVEVIDVNDPPTANDDSYSVNEDAVLTVAAPGVLTNDTDPDSDPLTVNTTPVSGPSHGTLTLLATGAFTYTPFANYNGTDSFVYQVSDGISGSDTATVNITVDPVNDPPVARDDFYAGTEDVVVSVTALAGVLSNDSDIDGGALVVNTAPVVAPNNGALVLNADGSFVYTPAPNFHGIDTFTYQVSDGNGGTAQAVATIRLAPVNDPPVANDDGYTTNEDVPLTISAPGILANDTDVDSSTLTAVLVTNPASGSLSLNADGSFTYTPNANFNGSDSFTYRANDGLADSNVATVTITVDPVNDLPVANDDGYTTNEDVPLTINAPGILANDVDVDNSSLTAVLVTNPTSGILSLNADGSFTYTPNANFNGSDSFTYRANDGTADSNIATVTITVNAVNDPPVAANDSHTIAEDTTLTVNAPGILANDSDIDGDTLNAVLVSGPASGSLTLNANGSFEYTPVANFNGSVSFTYVANDGSADSNIATVTITVNAVNDPPVANDDAYSTDEDTTLSVPVAGILANDSDIDGDTLNAVLVSGPASGSLTLNANGSFDYTPVADFNGSVSFTYRANDGLADSNIATVTITVNAVNDPPVAANDSYTIAEDTTLTVNAPGVLDNDSDIDGDTLNAVLVSGPASGSLTLNANGSFEYTPVANFNGSVSFTYVANDGSADSNVATVTITVDPVNDPPVANDDGYTTNEDVPLTINAPGILANDTDVDSSTLTAVLVTNPTSGTLSLNADGSFTYTPNANFNGSDSFTYRANDGSADSNIATVTITVNAVNDPPVAANDSYTIAEDTTLTVNAPGILANDSDIDGDTLNAVLVSGPASGSLTLNANGSFEYTPVANFNGSVSFTYVANDGTVDSNVATVTITVSPVNDRPVALDDAYSTDEDTPLSVPAPGVLANDSDVDGDALTVSTTLVSGPSHGGVSLATDGSLVYTPDANFNGSDSFVYRVSDGNGGTDTATVRITVNPINDGPVARDDSYSVNADTTLNVSNPGVLGNDSDVDGDTLFANTIVVSGPTNGAVTLNANGSFSYTPNATFVGSDSFVYEVGDGSGLTDTATVNITVRAVDICVPNKTLGFWRHQFSDHGSHQIDDATLLSYLATVSSVSGVFSEQVPAETLDQAAAVLQPGGADVGDNHRSNKQGKATQQAFAAWLNFAKGAVGGAELVPDVQGGPTGQTFLEAMAFIENILLDSNSTHGDYALASEMATAINEMDKSNSACGCHAKSDGGSDGHSDGNSDGHSDGNSDCGSDGHSDGGSDGHSDGGSDGHSDGGSDGDKDKDKGKGKGKGKSLLADSYLNGGPGSRAPLTDAALQQATLDAVEAWRREGVDPTTFQGIEVRLAQLPGTMLGYATSDLVLIDADGAGFGWDVVNGDNGLASMDLLTAVRHELGHVMGLDHSHDADDVMSDRLSARQSLLSSPRLGSAQGIFGIPTALSSQLDVSSVWNDSWQLDARPADSLVALADSAEQGGKLGTTNRERFAAAARDLVLAERSSDDDRFARSGDEDVDAVLGDWQQALDELADAMARRQVSSSHPAS